jgi:hypothetical protein
MKGKKGYWCGKKRNLETCYKISIGHKGKHIAKGHGPCADRGSTTTFMQKVREDFYSPHWHRALSSGSNNDNDNNELFRCDRCHSKWLRKLTKALAIVSKLQYKGQQTLVIAAS